jgi:acyl-CoA thioester hydrolase
MLSYDFTKRVRYSETDKMGYLYYGNYASYYEIGRVETMRSIGLRYKDLEEDYKIMMPVAWMECRYIQAAKYDDEITINTKIVNMPTKIIQFDHLIKDSQDQLLNKGSVKLFFVDMRTGKRISTPPLMQEKLKPYFG